MYKDKEVKNVKNFFVNVNCENRNDPDLVQAFLKKWWVESDFKAPSLRSHYGSKAPAVTITVLKYRNKIGKIVFDDSGHSVIKFMIRLQF
jgi:hypothetical protein